MFFWAQKSCLRSLLSLFHLYIKAHWNWSKLSAAFYWSLPHSFRSSYARSSRQGLHRLAEKLTGNVLENVQGCGKGQLGMCVIKILHIYVSGMLHVCCSCRGPMFIYVCIYEIIRWEIKDILKITIFTVCVLCLYKCSEIQRQCLGVSSSSFHLVEAGLLLFLSLFIPHTTWPVIFYVILLSLPQISHRSVGITYLSYCIQLSVGLRDWNEVGKLVQPVFFFSCWDIWSEWK